MASMNLVVLIGNVGKDAELRYGASGTPQARFSLATSYGSGDKQKTDWHNVTWFGDQAEKWASNVTKGKQVAVEGRISYRQWDDDQGVKHYMTEIIAARVSLLGKREDGGGEWEQAGRTRKGPDLPVTDVDDLPFD